MKLKLYITNMETDQIVKFVGYDHYYDEVMSKTSFWNYMSGCTVRCKHACPKSPPSPTPVNQS